MDTLTLPLATFKVFVPNLIASRDTDGGMRIEGTASSTVMDHHGDQITEKALRSMAKSAVGLTIWHDHDYKIPNSIFGTVQRTRVVKTGEVDPKTGKDIYDLKFGIKVASRNEKAVETFGHIEDGVQLGLSIGAMVPEGGATFEKANGGRYIVDELELVETSVVGIPANPRSWVDYAVKAFAGHYATNGETGAENELFLTKKLDLIKEMDDGPGAADMVTDEATDETTEAEGASEAEAATEEVVVEVSAEPSADSDGPAVDDTPELEKSAEPATGGTVEPGPVTTIVGESGPERVALLGVSHDDLGLEKGKKPAEHQHPHAHVHAGSHEHGYGDSKTSHEHDHAHVHSHGHDDSHDHQDEFNSYDHNHYHEGSHDEEHAHGETSKSFDPDIVKDQHPDILATRVSVWDGDKVIEVDTGRSKPKDGDQSAQATDNAGGTGASGGTTKSVAMTVTVDPTKLEETKDLIKALTMQVEASKAENEDLRKERDAAIELGQTLLDGTKLILEKVGSIPVGRKTLAGFEEPSLQKANKDLEGLAHIYGADVRAIFKRSPNATDGR